MLIPAQAAYLAQASPHLAQASPHPLHSIPLHLTHLHQIRHLENPVLLTHHSLMISRLMIQASSQMMTFSLIVFSLAAL